MNPKRYRGKLTIASAIHICRQILADNAPGSRNTFEGSLGNPNSERCQAIRRLTDNADSIVRRDRDHAWKRRQLRVP